MRTKHLSRRRFLHYLAAAGVLPAAARAGTAAISSINERMSGDFAPVHDPCIIRADSLYHVFCTGHTGVAPGLVPWRVSGDLLHWELRGVVFEAIPGWAAEAVPGTRGIWAPDIAYFNGRYHLYYSCSTFGSNRSVIGLATNATLDPGSADFAWEDQGLVTASDRNDEFNAIDPNHVVDRDGRHWLVFGSFWSGIKLLALDPATGKPPDGQRELRSLVSRPVPEGVPGAVEAPFMIERAGWSRISRTRRRLARRRSPGYPRPTPRAPSSGFPARNRGCRSPPGPRCRSKGERPNTCCSAMRCSRAI
jgi:arabinan endo-1,5-alpha-L-arabinosidase